MNPYLFIIPMNINNLDIAKRGGGNMSKVKNKCALYLR
jgi:hypothetical protein